MAGCGECVMSRSGQRVLGSTWRALNVDPSFTAIHAVELDHPSAEYLRRQVAAFDQVSVYEGDCNVVIPRDVLPRISRTAPTLAFLDPTAVQPTWRLVTALAHHRRGWQGRKVELLILYPFDMFINRWIRNELAWPKLTAFYGDERWREADMESTLIGEDTEARRERFLRLYSDRLKDDLHYKHVVALGPLTRGRRALYHMIFATDHDDAARIMSDVWQRPRALPDELFYDRHFQFHPPDW
jgi:three-Cys-motif partner protein